MVKLIVSVATTGNFHGKEANPDFLGLKEGDVNDGMRTTTTTPPPEMASLEVEPSNIIADGKVYNMLWERFWVAEAARYL